MTSVELNWYERVVLWMRIGAMPAPSMMEAHKLLRIIEKVRPTDQEQEETKLTIEGLNYRWTLPFHRYGDKKIELENEEAKALADGLDNHPLSVLVSDAAWMLKLIAQLRAAPAASAVIENVA